MEKILKIENVNDYKYEDPKGYSYSESYDGYVITTDKQEILCLISNYQSCCENWGVMESQDDMSDFIGSELLDVKLVDKALNVARWDKERGYGLDEGDVMFVNFETNRGTFQIAVYNSHNGYYGHSALVESKQLSERTIL